MEPGPFEDDVSTCLFTASRVSLLEGIFVQIPDTQSMAYLLALG